MEISLTKEALFLAFQFGAAFMVAAFLAGIFAALVKTFFALDEDIIGLTARYFAVAAVGFLFAAAGWDLLLDFTARIWDGSDIYFVNK